MRPYKIIDYYTSELSLRFLFLAWLVTLPFGASILPLSLGSFTIYPNLLFSLLLLPTVLLTFSNMSRSLKYLLVFLLIWFLVAAIRSFQIGWNIDNKFDVRSLIMQFIYAAILIGTFYQVGKEKFLSYLILGLRTFLVLLLAVGFIELMTGNHLSGTTTAKYENLPVGNYFYAPLFRYDNPNDFLCHVLVIFLLLSTLDKKFASNLYRQAFVLLTILLFAFYADSKIGIYIAGLSLVYVLSRWLVLNFNKVTKLQSTYFILTFSLFLVMLLQNDVYIGPKYRHSEKYRINDLQVIEKENGRYKLYNVKDSLSELEQKRLIYQIDSAIMKDPDASVSLRKNLLLNGLEFIKSNPVLGIGPGEFRQKHERKETLYTTHTLHSPHNFIIEIVSQYGILAWCYFGFLAYILFNYVKNIKTNFTQEPWLLLFFLFLPFIWMMTSSYLYFEIHWLFLPLMLIFNSYTLVKHDAE